MTDCFYLGMGDALDGLMENCGQKKADEKRLGCSLPVTDAGPDYLDGTRSISTSPVIIFLEGDR